MRYVFGLLLIGAGGYLLYIAIGGSNAVPTWLSNILSGNTGKKKKNVNPVGTG